jgi:SAM-dependent methyltransferase
VEIGAGIGTLAERLVAWDVVGETVNTAVDALPSNIATAQKRLQSLPLQLELEAIDLFDFVAREQGQRQWDLLIAHAFLDLMDMPRTLPQLFSLLRPGGYFYFSLNFDGATILQPTIDPPFDALVEQLYHRTMDERMTDGRPSGDSQSGRHLFGHLRQAGAEILAAGSSDWVLFGRDGR